MSMTPSSEHDQPLKVGYILKMFPRLSETFILNEILELERQGVEVEVFSLMAPGDGRFHGSLSELKLTIEYVLREKPESYWDKVRAGKAGMRWQWAKQAAQTEEKAAKAPSKSYRMGTRQAI